MEVEFNTYLESQLCESHKLNVLARELLYAGGKRIRAKVILSLAECFGLPADCALPWAAANEMLHNASLVHDDIQDQDQWRRGQPAAWAAHGTDVAISLGDYLLMKPFLLIQQMPTSEIIRLELLRCTAETVEKMALAQVEERALGNCLHDPSLNKLYSSVIAGKTGSLFELPILGLTLLSGLSKSESRPWLSAFAALGRSFQILDDLKDVLGLKGKPRQGEDLREGKVSALVVAHLACKPEDQNILAEFLSAKDKSRAPLWLQRFVESGAVGFTQAWLMREWDSFKTEFPDCLYREQIIKNIYQWLNLDEALKREK